MKEFLMANTDLSSQFEKISDHAKAATQHLRAAGQHTKDQLAADAASAREKATAASNQLKENADDSRNKVSSHWQEIRGQVAVHVAEMRTRAQEKADRFDAGVTAMMPIWPRISCQCDDTLLRESSAFSFS